MHAIYSVAKDHSLSVIRQKGKFGVLYFLETRFEIRPFALLPKNYGIKPNPRKTLIHCSGSVSGENSVQVLVTTTNSGSERNKFLSNQKKIQSHWQLVEVVERVFTSSERQTTENRNAIVNHPNGYFQNRLEGSFLRKPPRVKVGHIRKRQNISMYWSPLQ